MTTPGTLCPTELASNKPSIPFLYFPCWVWVLPQVSHTIALGRASAYLCEDLLIASDLLQPLAPPSPPLEVDWMQVRALPGII